MSQRFFYNDMFAKFHSCHGRREMGMIWSTNHHCINLLMHLIKHNPVIFESFGIGHGFEAFSSPIFIHIAKGYDVLVPGRILLIDQFTPIASPLAANANNSNIQSP